MLAVVDGHEEAGGLEASFARVVPELAARGIRMEAAVRVGGGRDGGATVDFLARHLPTRPLHGARALAAAAGGADVVHLHAATCLSWSATAALASRLRCIPTVLTVHLPSYPPAPAALRSLARLGARFAARGVVVAAGFDRVLVPSDAARAVLCHRFRPLRLAPVTAWCGVPDRGWAPISPRGGLLRAAFVGRLTAHKRPAVFLEAVAEARRSAPVTAVVVGDGPLRADLEAHARSLNLEGAVRFTGAVADPTPAMLASDVLVLTSHTEGNPLVVMEAAAAGRATIARSSVEGMAESWAGIAVTVAAQADPPDFAAALVGLAQDRPRLARLGAAARRRFEQAFSAERAADRLAAVYRSLYRAGR